MIKPTSVLMALLVASPVSVAQADDVLDAIKAATEAYESGDQSTAIASLNEAIQWIQQSKAQQLAASLPAALEGWTAEEAESNAGGGAMFGGGITASRHYVKDDAWIAISIVTDSPLLKGMLAMFSNPMFASASGGKMEKIGGQKVISTFKDSEKSGQYQIVVDNRYLITLEGSGVMKADMETYTEAIDFDALSKL